jgi:hydroxyacylglutathione hydrolase
MKKIATHIIPIFRDNYVPIIIDRQRTEACVVDPGSADEIITYLEAENLTLTRILITHHHSDHIGGVERLRERYGATVFGYEGDQERLPALDKALQDHFEFTWSSLTFEMLYLPGHTTGHIAYYCPKLQALFSGDVLFMMGCGRLFEGTPAQMLSSLKRIAQLPDETQIYCAHEYTQHNGRFALTIDPSNEALKERMAKVDQMREKDIATVPGTLGVEKATNPFLRCSFDSIKQGVGLTVEANELEAFTHLREARNNW